MQGIQSWCYTLFAGVLFSGIVLMLTPDERYRPLMRVILGGFLLVCMVTWVGQINVKIDFSAGDAERQREQTAQRAEEYFTGRAMALSQRETEKTAAEYLADYGIKPGEFQIYIKTEEHPNGTKVLYLLLYLPQRAAEHSLVISRALGYRLGADVRIETYGTEEAWQYRQKAG